MHFKRNFMLYILIFLMLFNMSFPCFADALFSVDKFELKNARVILSGKTEKAKDTVTLIVKNKETGNIFLLDETVSSDENVFSFDLKMPDEMKGVAAEGNFYITLASNGDIISGTDYEFEFVGSIARGNFVDAIKLNPSKLKEMIEKSLNKVTVKTIGIALDDYTNLEDSLERDNVISFFNNNTNIQSLTEQILCSNFNTAIYATYIKCGQASFALNKLGYVYDDKTFSKITDNNQKIYITNCMNNKAYSDEESIKNDYEFYYSVYALNNAKSSDMAEILEKHKDALGIKDSNEYSKFASLTGETLTKAERALAKEIEKSAITTVEKINSALKSAYEAATYVSTPSSSSGGGGGSSGKGSTISFNTTPVVNVPSSSTNNESTKFSDIDSVLWAKEAIEKLNELEIVSGYGDNLFMPNNEVKREEFIKMLVVALDICDENANCSFDDVKEGDWHYKYIASAVKNGITLGNGNGKFGVGEFLKREDVALMLFRCLSFEKNNDESFAFADEKNIAVYAKEAVYTLVANGIINGIGDNLFSPKQSCTRAMAAQLIYSSIIKNTGGDK